MLYYAYLDFVIDCFGMFVLTFRTYQLYRDYCLQNDYLFFGKNNEHSEQYYYRRLAECIAENRYV